MAALLGNNAMATLTSALSKFSGTDQRQSGSLIGMLTPLIFGQLTKAQGAQALDGAAVARFLSDQNPTLLQLSQLSSTRYSPTRHLQSQPSQRLKRRRCQYRRVHAAFSNACRGEANCAKVEGKSFAKLFGRGSRIRALDPTRAEHAPICVGHRRHFRAHRRSLHALPIARARTNRQSCRRQPRLQRRPQVISQPTRTPSMRSTSPTNFIGELSAALLGINDQNNAQAALPLLTASATSSTRLTAIPKRSLTCG